MKDHKYGTLRIMCILLSENFVSKIMKNLLILPFMENSSFKSTTDRIVGQRQVSESQFTPQVISVFLLVEIFFSRPSILPFFLCLPKHPCSEWTAMLRGVLHYWGSSIHFHDARSVHCIVCPIAKVISSPITTYLAPFTLYYPSPPFCFYGSFSQKPFWLFCTLKQLLIFFLNCLNNSKMRFIMIYYLSANHRPITMYILLLQTSVSPHINCV